MVEKSVRKSKGVALIKKSNDLIESRYKFDIWELRFFLSVLSKVHKDDTGAEVYRIKYRDVIKDFNLKHGDSYASLREGAKKLLKQTISMRYEKDGTIRSEDFHLVRTIDYLVDSGGVANTGEQEYIDVKIEEALKPFLLQLSKNFTAYDLRNIAKLGVYAIRLYELLKQYENIGHRRLEVDNIKMMFQLETEYPLFANFYQKVIQPSILDINKHTDLNVLRVEKIKEGRKIIALSFKFSKKSQEEIKKLRIDKEEPKTLFDFYSEEEPQIEEAEIIEIEQVQSEKDKLYLQFEDVVVKNFGVTPSVFLQLTDKYTAEQIEQAIRVTRRMRATAQIKSNVAGYFVKALKNGYTDEKEEQEKKKAIEAEKQRRHAEENQRIEAEKREKQERINQKIYQLTSESKAYALSAIEALKFNPLYQKRIEMKEAQLGKTLELKDYRDDEFLTAGIRAKIVELNRDKFEDII